MLDKLQPKTVYVPLVHPENGDRMQDYIKDGFVVAKKVTGVYPLTGKELADLLTEYEESLHGNSTSFLKEKGVEI